MKNFIFRWIAEYREHAANGRIPEAPVLERYQKRVREIISGPYERQLFAEVGPGTAEVLGCRRKDARERYKEPAGRAYGLVRPERESRLVIREICKNPGYNWQNMVT